MYTSREPHWMYVQRGSTRYIMKSRHSIAFIAQRLGPSLPLPGITTIIKRVWMGRAWMRREKRSSKGFDHLNEGGQEHHNKDHHLRPYGEVLKQQAKGFQFDPTPLHKADRRVAWLRRKTFPGRDHFARSAQSFQLPPPTKY
jgi:hypothetical protein